jgi:hypothetical protein
MKKIVLIGIVAVVLLAAGVGTALALQDDDERNARGGCGNATYELTAEADDGGLEVNFELQSAAPGETWDVVVEQDGTPLWQGERITDDEGELDIDVFADEDRGGEFTASATARGVAGAEPCEARVTR